MTTKMKALFYYCVTVLIYSSITDGKNVTTLADEGNTVLKNTTDAPIRPTTTTRRPLLQGIRLPCSCSGGQCGCCTGVILDRFKQKACMNITYEPDDFALTAAVSMNGKVLYKRSVSGKNPAPICFRIPRLPIVRFCVQFSNIYITGRNIHLCVDMEANWQDLTLLEWSFDCIRMGASGVAVVGQEDGGGLPANPIDAVDQTDEDYDDSARNLPLINENNIESILFDRSLTNVPNVYNRSHFTIQRQDKFIRIAYGANIAI